MALVWIRPYHTVQVRGVSTTKEQGASTPDSRLTATWSSCFWGEGGWRAAIGGISEAESFRLRNP